MSEEEFQKCFSPGTLFMHCGRECVVMRYICGTELDDGMRYEYTDAAAVIRTGFIPPLAYPAIEAQNPATRMEIWPEHERLREALKTTRQALMEVQHAQECGPGWYTRGVSGMYQQTATWVRKGLAAAREVLE